MKINKNYANLEENYLFATIASKVKEHARANPNKKIIRLGIGDVTLPLAPVVVESLKNAALEMGHAETFRGYGEYQGYNFLRQAIVNYYEKKGVNLTTDEVFVSDGVKSDSANILDIFHKDNVVLIPNPTFPVYVDANVMDGRKIIYAHGTKDNNFLPMPDENVKVDIIYMCSPNNPTGAHYTKAQLKEWVNYAIKNQAVILFDGAYECFVTDPELPTSIFEIEGAQNCAIEFLSFSKMAGFTGTRCSFTVISKELKREETSLHHMWLRRQTTKYNGVSYIVQRGAQAALSDEGMAQIKESLAYYRQNIITISQTLDKLGVWYTGGKNAPYIWLECPGGMGSWEFFDYLLEEAGVVGTPGEGFGSEGKGYFRLSAFGNKEDTIFAMEKFTEAVEKLKK